MGWLGLGLVIATLVVWVAALGCGLRALRSRGCLARVRAGLAAAAWATLGTLLVALLGVRQAFHAFSDETLVAYVTTRRLSAETFELTYQPAQGAEPHRSSAPRQRTGEDQPDASLPPSTDSLRVRLRGDQWVISGGLVKWHPWLTALGVPSYHKPMRVAGQWSGGRRAREAPLTVELLEPGPDWVWEGLYRLQSWLPFIEAVYGSSAFAYVEPRATHAVSVTASGYLIKRVARPGPRMPTGPRAPPSSTAHPSSR